MSGPGRTRGSIVPSIPRYHDNGTVFDLGSNLCANCSTVDWETVLSAEHNNCDAGASNCSVNKALLSIGPFATWETDTCNLCGLLAAAAVTSDSIWKEKTSYKLRTTCSRQLNRRYHHITHLFKSMGVLPASIVLSVDASLKADPELLVAQMKGSEAIIRSCKADSIDFSILQGWIDFCHESHTQRCVARYSQHVEHMKVIDCNTRMIVAAPDAEYVTLSYLWGQNSEPPLFSLLLPRDLPPTIEDAITVTLQLGLQYLWVDRYCINQQNQELAMSQINHMDSIYNNSSLTIVALCGEDPSFGLPGISRPRQHAQAHGKLGDLTLVSLVHKTWRNIQSSSYSFRGWVFQEILLSRRRLIFTEEEVYFECYGMYSGETLNLPLHLLHTTDQQRFLEKYCYDDDIVGVFPAGVGTDTAAIFDRIVEYSQRSFTHKSDRLKGFQGILAAFESQEVYSWWGVPIQTFIIFDKNDKRILQPKAACPTEYASVLGLCWEVKKPDTFERITGHGLPSWSWAGWSGPVVYSFFYCKYLHRDCKAKVEYELLDGSKMGWSQIHQRYSDIQEQQLASPFIHVSGETLYPVRCLYNSPGSTEPTYLFEMNDGFFLGCRVSLADIPCPPDVGSLKFVILLSLSVREEHTNEDVEGDIDESIDEVFEEAVEEDSDSDVSMSTDVEQPPSNHNFTLILSNLDGNQARVGGFWWCYSNITLYDTNYNLVHDPESKKEIEYTKSSMGFGDDAVRYRSENSSRRQIRKQYGTHWYEELKSTWESHRVG